MDIGSALAALGAAIVAAAVALALLAGGRRLRIPPASVLADLPAEAVFLFDDDALVDASDRGRALLASLPGRGRAWARLQAFVVPRFPEFDGAMRSLPETGQVRLTGTGADPMTLIAEWRGGLRRITLVDPHIDPQVQIPDILSQRAQEEELARLRQAVDLAPCPMWQTDPEGAVRWANAAYATLVERAAGGEGAAIWPFPALFPEPSARAAGTVCLSLPGADRPLWFERRSVAGSGDDAFCYALPADRAVQAEQALRDFVQTLSKTFAQLPIGLAIFDRQRKLQLFNPALTDLTGLPVDFLSLRPAFAAFLDALRDHRMIPEPRDYRRWRNHMTSLERSAGDAGFEETWSLPNGQTYRVQGRPHPEGALALLFEDITAEITRTRSFRADLELGQSVIDSMNEAIAVFSAAGSTVMSNAAYAALWGEDPAGTLADHGIREAAARWRAETAADPVWTRAERFVVETGPREPWDGLVRLSDGRPLLCRFAPLAGGATLAGFTVQAGHPPHRAEVDAGAEPPVRNLLHVSA
jgi:PAS domain-containing protein